MLSVGSGSVVESRIAPVGLSAAQFTARVTEYINAVSEALRTGQSNQLARWDNRVSVVVLADESVVSAVLAYFNRRGRNTARVNAREGRYAGGWVSV